MWDLVRSIYARRIVNVNVNVLAAGALALGPVLLIVKGYHRLGLPSEWLPAVTFVADVVCDVAIYYGLHFLANHAPWRLNPVHAVADATVEHVPFFRDATRIQFQRMVIAPILYGLWLGSQWVLVHTFRWDPVPATAVGFVLGVGVARTLHTMWMLWEGRRAAAGLAAGKSPEARLDAAEPKPTPRRRETVG